MPKSGLTGAARRRAAELVPAGARSALRAGEGRVRARAVRLDGAPGVASLPPATLRPLLRRLVAGSPTVLDVGCGRMAQLAELDAPVRVGVEVHRPYLEHRVEDPTLVPLHLDARRLEDVLVPRSFATVTLIDVIEHFTETDARAVLNAVERIAARRVVVFTPRGEFPQEGFDGFGLGGEEYQRHRSTWEPEQFAGRGYRVAVLRGFHGPGNASFDEAFPEGGPPIDAILAWKNRPGDRALT